MLEVFILSISELYFTWPMVSFTFKTLKLLNEQRSKIPIRCQIWH